MKKPRLLLNLSLACIFALAFTGCKDDDENEKDYQSQTTVATESGFAQQVSNNAKFYADKVMAMAVNAKTGTLDTLYTEECLVATLDMTSTPSVLTLDFGEENCLCADGIYRRGKIIASFNGIYFYPGTVVNYSFENYYVNDYHIEGTITVTNMGLNTSQNLYWDIVVNGQITKPDNGGTFTWNAHHQIEYAEGITTPLDYSDDLFLVTGSATGTTTGGQTYTNTIVTPLQIRLTCQWIGLGVINIEPAGWPLFVLDYGDGTCDSTATLTVDGHVYTISL